MSLICFHSCTQERRVTGHKLQQFKWISLIPSKDYSNTIADHLEPVNITASHLEPESTLHKSSRTRVNTTASHLKPESTLHQINHWSFWASMTVLRVWVNTTASWSLVDTVWWFICSPAGSGAMELMAYGPKSHLPWVVWVRRSQCSTVPKQSQENKSQPCSTWGSGSI